MNKVISILTTLCLAITFVAAGLAACIAPPVTSALSNVFSRDDVSPFSRAELVKVAEATRDYSFGSHDLARLYQTIYEVDSEYAARLTAVGAKLPEDFPKLPDTTLAPNATKLASVFKDASVKYVYDEKTVSHLDDCHQLFISALPGLVIAAALALIGIIAGGVRMGKRKLGKVFMAAGIIVLLAFIALGVWAIVDFDGFFTTFHQAFFAKQGNWAFPYDSLLICALPEAFWMGMGAIWLVVAVLLSVIFILVGNALRKAKKGR